MTDSARSEEGVRSELRLEGVGRRVVVATHRRSGTHLVIDLLRRQFSETCGAKRFGEPLNRVYLTLELLSLAGRAAISEHAALDILRRARRPIIKTHGLPGAEAGVSPRTTFVEAVLADADVLYVYRDGRDVLCSLHRYMQSYAPEARVGISEFIRQMVHGRSRVRLWSDHVRAWRAQPGVCIIALESLRADEYRTLERIGGAISLRPKWREPVLPKPLRGKWHGRVLRLFARNPSATTILGRPGGAAPLEWRAAFTRADRDFFERESGGLLGEFGYETSGAWVDDEPRERGGET